MISSAKLFFKEVIGITLPKKMIKKEQIRTKSAPLPIGQYSQGIRVGDLLFVAGQVGQDPDTGKVVDSSWEAEIKQTFDNIKSIVEEAGSSMDNVVRTLTFVKDLGMYETFKKVRAKYLPTGSPPVNSFIQISDLQLGANIEIETIAMVLPQEKKMRSITTSRS